MSLVRVEGMHYYINIANYYEVIENEEKTFKYLKHSIHALDNFFSSIEIYARSFSEEVVIEKITGSRLHIYIKEDIDTSLKIIWRISRYAKSLSLYFKEKIVKYKSLMKFKLQFGASYGHFYEFEFEKGFVEEMTTIGYAANFAAKLQSVSSLDGLSISKNVFEQINNPEIKKQFKEMINYSLTKYGQNKYYEITIKPSSNDFDKPVFTSVNERIMKNNLGDIEFSGVNKLLNYNNISITNSKRLMGIPIFADIRNFTNKFDSLDINLTEMALKTSQILNTMYDTITKSDGVHIQFQGDREMAVFHNVDNQTCYTKAIIASMKLLDAINGEINIGIGASFGELIATKFGARGNKDNILLGKTINEADKLEDCEAKEGEIVISSYLFEKIKNENYELAAVFNRRKEYYVTSCGYKEFVYYLQCKESKKNKNEHRYNGAWLK